MLDLLVTGYASIDYLFRISRSAGVDETAVIETGSDGEYGGCGLNVAVALARLGFKVGAVVALGDDPAGRDYLAYLATNGVDTRDIVLLPGQKTSRSYIFSNPQGGNQIYFYPGAAKAWQPPLQIHHLASQQARACLVTVGDPRYNREFVRQSILCGLPVFWQMKADIQAYPPEQLSELLSASRVLFMNLTEARYLMDTLGVDRIEALQQHPQQVLALTLGSKGSRVFTQDRWCDIPPIPGAELIDPTGAGDGYTAGFLAAWFKGYSPEICGRVGAVLASFVIEKTGCQTNLPDWKTLDGRYTSFFQQTLTTE